MIVTFPKGINGYNSHSICSTFTDSMLINFSSGSDLFHSAFLFSIVFNSIYFTSCLSGQVSDEQIIGNCRILQSVIYLICEDGISVNLIIRELAQIFCLGFFFFPALIFHLSNKPSCWNHYNLKPASIHQFNQHHMIRLKIHKDRGNF